MCDVKKYSEIYKDIKAFQPEDTLQLVLEAETEEEKTSMNWSEIFCFRQNRKKW